MRFQFDVDVAGFIFIEFIYSDIPRGRIKVVPISRVHPSTEDWVGTKSIKTALFPNEIK